MQIGVLNGVYTDNNSDYRTAYPENLIPVPMSQGISKGYLRPAEGITEFATTTGRDRGGINWNGVLYRVIGEDLVRVSSDGTRTVIGTIGGSGQVTMDYSFDYLSIASSKELWLYDGTTLKQNTDSDLGDVLDQKWIDGYFMTTDGENLVVTELGDPFSVNPLKYGSSEVDPDNVLAIKKIRNEAYAVNRFTCEVFDNVGSEGFPFQRVEGAQIQKGALGTHTVCVFENTLAFLGSGRNESLSIYLGINGGTTKIATREIDQILQEYTEQELETCLVEERISESHKFLYVHLPDKTLVFDAGATQQLGQPIWFILHSGLLNNEQYQANNFVWCYDKWISGDPTQNRLGVLDDSLASHYDAEIGWKFGTAIIYNESNGAILHELELVCLTGRAALGDNPVVWTSYSTDGQIYSQENSVRVGTQGQRNKRIVWLQQGFMENTRIQKFRGTSKSMLSVARLEARLEPLAY